MDCRATFYTCEVFFVDKWSFSLQDPIFLVFFKFSKVCLS